MSMERNEWHPIKSGLAAAALLIGIGLIALAVYVVWMLVFVRWSVGAFVLSINLLFLGIDLCVAGWTKRKPRAVDLLSFLIPL